MQYGVQVAQERYIGEVMNREERFNRIVREAATQNEIALRRILDRNKGLICNEFEKVCPTEVSLRRMVKEMHDIFDDLEQELRQTLKV